MVTKKPTAKPTPKPKPKPKPAPKPKPKLDPRFKTCAEAKAKGYGPYVKGKNPEYQWYKDADRDGTVCER